MRIILIGFGSVGNSFAKILHQSDGELLQRFGLRPRIVAVVDRGGAAVDPHGLYFEKV
ncbi:homoserine dehydrogenase, partial [Candidatus Bathyarchaeota archaeon]